MIQHQTEKISIAHTRKLDGPMRDDFRTSQNPEPHHKNKSIIAQNFQILLQPEGQEIPKSKRRESSEGGVEPSSQPSLPFGPEWSQSDRTLRFHSARE